MHETKNMSLTVWDSEEDKFDHSKLAGDLEIIDGHNHIGPPHGIKLNGALALEEKSVTHNVIGKEAVLAENIGKGAVGSEQIEESFLPLGATVLWYRKNPTDRPGGGWEILDGRPWSEITNKLGYSTGNMPNTIKKFPMGVAFENVGTTGGSETLNLKHAHVVESHTHTTGPHAHTVGTHIHGIAVDGSHEHGFHQFAGEEIAESFPLRQIAVQKHNGPITDGEAAQAINLPQAFSGEHGVQIVMHLAGEHSHGGATGGSAPFATSTSGETTTSAAAPSTTEKLGNESIIPPWVGFCYIIRVR